jgi:hypothetical protein
MFLLDATGTTPFSLEPLGALQRKRKVPQCNSIPFIIESSIVASMFYGAIYVCWHTNDLGENYDQTGSLLAQKQASSGTVISTKSISCQFMIACCPNRMGGGVRHVSFEHSTPSLL